MIEVRNFINGKAGAGYSGSFQCQTTFFEKRYALPNSSVADVGFALSAARKAHALTAALSFSQRKNILVKAAQEFSLTQEHEEFIVASTGMPVKHVRARVAIGRELMRSLADICADRYGVHHDAFVRTIHQKNVVAGYELRLTREGPVSVFLPPNDPAEPFFIFSHAVLSGQTLVVKPSQAEPLTSTLLAQILTTAGYPIGGINVVHWNSAERKGLGHYICKETPLRIMMGSSAAVQEILTSSEGEVVSFGTTIQYCAGHTASIVLEDADIVLAAQHIVKSAYEWTIDCVSTKTVIVVGKETREKLIVEMQKLVSKCAIGDPREPMTDIGYIPEPTLAALDASLHGQHTFGAVHHHIQYTKISPVQLSPVLCEAASLNFPLFSQEPPYTLVMYACKSETEAIDALEKMREYLPTKKRMGIGIYTKRHIEAIMPLLHKCHAHLVFFNTPTINLNFALNHQDVFLSDELLAPVSITSL